MVGFSLLAPKTCCCTSTVNAETAIQNWNSNTIYPILYATSAPHFSLDVSHGCIDVLQELDNPTNDARSNLT